MKIKNISTIVGLGLLCLILCGCITEYIPTGIDEEADILVVEGIITDDESFITLSRSITLTDDDNSWTSTQYVNNAKISVECNDGTYSAGSLYDRRGRYIINTGKLNPERQYSLKIEIDGDVYGSVFSYPIQTPEIDSIFWAKRGKGQPVMIYVAAHDPAGKVLYYRWSFREDWEYHAEQFLHPDGFPEPYPYYCWDKANNNELLLGSAEKTIFGKVTDLVTEMPSTSRKLSYLYRIDVSQNVISKKAYDYFANIKKNAEQSGSIFAPIPSELRGNITCTTDPERPVIGYVDVSTTTKKRRYISNNEGAYDHYSNWDCRIFEPSELFEMFGGIPSDFILFSSFPPTFIRKTCVDCTSRGGTTQKPDDWPNNH